jgi:hypothetical protein
MKFVPLVFLEHGGRKVMIRPSFSASDELSHISDIFIDSPHVIDLIIL